MRSVTDVTIDNPNFGLKTPPAIKNPTLGLEAVSLLKMNREDELPKNLTIKNPTLPKRASVDHLNTSKINTGSKLMISLSKFV